MTLERRRASSTKQPRHQHSRESAATSRRPRTTHAPPLAHPSQPLPVAAAPLLPSLRASPMMQLLHMEHQRRACADEDEDESSYSSNSSSDHEGASTGFIAARQTQSSSSKVRVPRATRAHRTATATLAHAAESTTKSYKPRKATHVVRKEEKEELEKQLKILQAELLGFKYRALYPEMSSATSSSNGSSCANSSNTPSPLNPGFTGDVLRDAIKIQQLSLASVQAVISNYVRQHKVSPIQTPIRLTSDQAARKQTLQALKDGKLAEARRFLAERTRGLDMTKQFSEEERFETDEGDYCVLQFDITPLPKARSVRELFDMLFFFIFNVEIKITEALGSVTVREDDESGDKSIAHHRLVSRNQQNVLTEVSTVHFSDFSATTEDLGSGMIVADFVDDDALYPYRPSERVRHDLSAVLTITPERRRVTNRQDANGPDEEEIIVVLTRWSMLKQHQPAFFIDEDALLEMRGMLGSWTDEMFKAVRERAAER